MAKDKEKILIVDDELEVIESMQEWLEVHGFEVLTAQDGKTGLGIAFGEKPDLILLDVVMPGMSGYQMLQRLRAKEETRNIPVLMLTAKGRVEDILESQSLRVDHFVKPADSEELLATVKKQLRLRRTD